MLQIERKFPKDDRLDFVSIVTPNHVHYRPAKLSLEAGFHVIIDKPLTFSLAEAKQLKKVVEKTNLVFAVTHTYTGYPLVKEARNMVHTGKLGRIRKVYVNYTQGWLATPLETSGQKQAAWRTDPSKSGAGGAIGDIGTHAANLAEYITGLKITEVNAELTAVIKERKLDDDCAMLLRFDNGCTGVLTATQIAAGEENDLTIRVYGEKGGLEWHQQDPNSLVIKWLEKPTQIIRSGGGYLSSVAKSNTRVPSGHPEGYLEAFANIYLNFAKAVRDHRHGKSVDYKRYDFPNVNDGVRGMAFIETALKSSKSKSKWEKMKI
jgi:predicted dehydrogenase